MVRTTDLVEELEDLEWFALLKAPTKRMYFAWSVFFYRFLPVFDVLHTLFLEGLRLEYFSVRALFNDLALGDRRQVLVGLTKSEGLELCNLINYVLLTTWVEGLCPEFLI